MSVKRSFEFVEGTSSKFWEVWREGTKVMTRYGRIGSSGQTTVKDEGDEAKASKLYDKLISEKTKKGYLEKGGAPAKSPAPAKSAKSAKKAAASMKWTTDTRKRLHGSARPAPTDPPDAVPSVDDAWKELVERYQHLTTVTLEGATPTGTGAMKGVVSAVVKSFAKDAPPQKLDLDEELCRAALMQLSEGGWAQSADVTWEEWSWARALISLWLSRGGVEFVFDALNHPATFRLATDSRGPAEGHGSFSSYGFSKSAAEREQNRFSSHPRALTFDVPPLPATVGQFHDGKDATTKVPMGEREWYRVNAKAVTTPDGGTMMVNDPFFFFTPSPLFFLWALRSQLAALPEAEHQAALAAWKKKGALREDLTDAASGFLFSKEPALVSAAVKRALAAKEPSPLAELLLCVAQPGEVAALAKAGLANGAYAFDVVSHLEAGAKPVLTALANLAKGYIQKQWKAALKLVG